MAIVYDFLEFLCTLGTCSHWYESHPSVGTCPIGPTAALECDLQAQVTENSSVSITWYWTQNAEDEGIQGTLIQTNGSDKYFASAPFVGDQILMTGLVRLFNFLQIRSVSTNDTGFYWCQIVINGSILLEPSCPTELTAIQTNDTMCTDTGTISPRKCADVTIIPVTSQLPLPTPTLSTDNTNTPMSSQYPETSAVQLASTTYSGMDRLSGQTSNTISTEIITTASTPGPMQSKQPSSSSSSQCEVGGASCSIVYGAVGAAGVVVLVGGALVGLLGCVYLIRKRTVRGKSKPIVDNL